MTKAKSAKVRVGISGWRYEPWRGAFYPEKLRQKDELAFASAQLPTIEINGTFYSLQGPNSFAQWRDDTPAGFVFSVKGPRYITHIRRLKEVEAPLANFFASGVLQLGEKLGPFLWQFPPNFKFDPARIERFLALLPHDSDAAVDIARHHESRMAGRAWFERGPNRPLRHAMEIRNDSFVTTEFIDLLRRHDVALVVADTVEWPRLMDVTSDFVYCRLHGSEVLYASGYGRKAIDQWAARVTRWVHGGEPANAEKADADRSPKPLARDVYVYFDNDMKVLAPRDARALIARLRKSLGDTVMAGEGVTPEVRAHPANRRRQNMSGRESKPGEAGH